MSASSEVELRLAPPAASAGSWLFALAWVLPMTITSVALAVPLLAGAPLKLVDGNLPLTVALALGGMLVLCSVLWWVLSRALRRQSLRLSGDALEVRSTFYRCTTPLAELKLEQARIVDLDEHPELRAMLKTNGFGLPGFRSGWFLLRNRRRSFVATADGRRKLWLPGSGRHDLLLEPADPAALLARLRELAASQGRG